MDPSVARILVDYKTDAVEYGMGWDIGHDCVSIVIPLQQLIEENHE